MVAMTVSAKGQVVIPAEIREQLGIGKGDKVKFVSYGGAVYLVRMPADPIEASLGFLQGKTSLTEGLLRDRLEEVAREK